MRIIKQLPKHLLIYKEEKYDYFDLDKHFTLGKPKNYKRIPRKLKKKIMYFDALEISVNLIASKDLGVYFWVLNWYINPDYNRFKIKKITEYYGKF